MFTVAIVENFGQENHLFREKLSQFNPRKLQHAITAVKILEEAKVSTNNPTISMQTNLFQKINKTPQTSLNTF